MVVVRLDPEHARRLGARTEADGEDRPERDRHLAEEVADVALADDARDPVDELDRLDRAVEDGEEARSPPSCAAYSPGASVISAAARASRSRSASERGAKIAIDPISSAVTIRRAYPREVAELQRP